MYWWTCSPVPRTLAGGSDMRQPAEPVVDRREAGVALPGVLLLAAFLVGITGWLVGHVRTDVVLAMEQRDEAAAVQLSAGALQAVALALAQVADWTVVGTAPPMSCPAPTGPVVALDETQERAWLQAATDAASRWGADTPQWQPVWACHASGVLGRWPEGGAMPGVAVWVADDPEGDGSPLTSANQRLLLHAVAVGRSDARGMAAATISRQMPGAPVELAAWRGPGGG